MKSIQYLLFFFLTALSVNAQTDDQMNDPVSITVMDSAMMEKPSYTPYFAVGGRYYFNPLKNTRRILAENGFSLDEEAFEYHLQFGQFPKIFYFQQLGNLTNGNYAAINGFGLKKDLTFSIFKNSHFVLAPYVEAGVGYYRMNIAKGVGANSIITVLNSSVENYYLDNFVFSGDVGLNLGFNFNIANTKINVLFNGGFIANIPTEWRLAQSLAFREKIELTSPYAGATIRVDLKDCCSNMNSCCK